MVRALDTSINKSAVFILDARTMIQIGKLDAPSPIPFGFHNKWFSKKSLGMTPVNSPPAHSIVPQGFPAVWTGDKFYKAKCQSMTGTAAETLPDWMDGFFFTQVSLSLYRHKPSSKPKDLKRYAGLKFICH
ncbi:MAG: carotenoid oxygenase family protein, partial [Gammaproteobacteria bacterium]|nr:carotenoid oxygenase family protein [Gammaproteobacteria bacterium]